MSELKELKRQKREIEARIKELTCQSVTYGAAKIGVEHYPTGKPDRHYVAIRYQPVDDGKITRWVSVYAANDKQSVIDKIPDIISDLKGLYEEAQHGKVN